MSTPDEREVEVVARAMFHTDLPVRDTPTWEQRIILARAAIAALDALRAKRAQPEAERCPRCKCRKDADIHRPGYSCDYYTHRASAPVSGEPRTEEGRNG